MELTIIVKVSLENLSLSDINLLCLIVAVNIEDYTLEVIIGVSIGIVLIVIIAFVIILMIYKYKAGKSDW